MAIGSGSLDFYILLLLWLKQLGQKKCSTFCRGVNSSQEMIARLFGQASKEIFKRKQMIYDGVSQGPVLTTSICFRIGFISVGFKGLALLQFCPVDVSKWSDNP